MQAEPSKGHPCHLSFHPHIIARAIHHRVRCFGKFTEATWRHDQTRDCARATISASQCGCAKGPGLLTVRKHLMIPRWVGRGKVGRSSDQQLSGWSTRIPTRTSRIVHANRQACSVAQQLDWPISVAKAPPPRRNNDQTICGSARISTAINAPVRQNANKVPPFLCA